jgi:putative transposase
MVEDIAREHPGQPIELWFQDEMRVGQKGTLTRVWTAKGTRATAPRDLRFGYASLFGAVCPARDTGAAIVMPMVNTIAMNEHLLEIGRCVSPGAHAVLILDGAGWHPHQGLAVPANITLLFLPSPAFAGAGSTVPNSTRSRSCGTSCAGTSSPTASSTHSKT